tara:strand:+ start:36 stop:947 length:912 start_codon:yes stop_codon:yes gene_type:complete
MILKLFAILFLGFISTFVGEIKADEICSFTSAEEYEKCFNNVNALKVPEYPLLIEGGGGSNKYQLVQEFTNISCTGSSWSPNKKRLHLGSQTGNELSVKEGVWKRFTNKGIKVYRSYEIPRKKFIQWSKEKVYCDGMNEDFYSVSYLNQSFDLKKLYFRTGRYGIKKGDLIPELLEITSGMKINEKRDKKYNEKLIYERIKDIDKRLAVIKLFIKDKDQQETDCFNVNETKYPDLIKEYKNLSREIRALRKKLDLSINDDFKIICGEPKGSRPLWMEEKIKGCYKYPTKKQRDYCINVYSPYG